MRCWWASAWAARSAPRTFGDGAEFRFRGPARAERERNQGGRHGAAGPGTWHTFRLFKQRALEDKCEDFGQEVARSIAEHPHFYDLDDHHRFYTGKPMLV